VRTVLSFSIGVDVRGGVRVATVMSPAPQPGAIGEKKKYLKYYRHSLFTAIALAPHVL